MRRFSFAGQNSGDYGIFLERAPEIPQGMIRSETQTVLGSSKVLHYTEGPDAMDPIQITLECAAPGGNINLTGIAAWLRGGGRLIMPDDPGHYYKAWVSKAPDLARVFRTLGWRRFSVEMECEAHRYQYPEQGATEIAQGLLVNPCTAPAEPLFKLYGTGDNSIIINGTTFDIADMTDYVMLDCETQMIYREDVNLGTSVQRTGDWPVIPAGGCNITWTGLTKVEITPRWRDY